MMKLHKSKNNRVFLGVCGGLSETLDIDAPIIRLLFIFGAIFTGSILFWLYLILAIVLPAKE